MRKLVGAMARLAATVQASNTKGLMPGPLMRAVAHFKGVHSLARLANRRSW